MLVHQSYSQSMKLGVQVFTQRHSQKHILSTCKFDIKFLSSYTLAFYIILSAGSPKLITVYFLRVHTYNMTNSHKTVQSGLNLHLRDTQEHHMYKGLINVTFKSKLVTFPVSMPDVLDCEQSLFPLRES